jgi:hypothetical protein
MPIHAGGGALPIHLTCAKAKAHPHTHHMTAAHTRRRNGRERREEIPLRGGRAHAGAGERAGAAGRDACSGACRLLLDVVARARARPAALPRSAGSRARARAEGRGPRARPSPHLSRTAPAAAALPAFLLGSWEWPLTWRAPCGGLRGTTPHRTGAAAHVRACAGPRLPLDGSEPLFSFLPVRVCTSLQDAVRVRVRTPLRWSSTRGADSARTSGRARSRRADGLADRGDDRDARVLLLYVRYYY